uniref:PH01B019A14.23 protein n=1 Tax=Phyllostachys edulis TaxID=38705 RepID=L0P1P0_PHYED|nr:PH01B019A14.23 [Phyllostachys edulis]
MQETGTRQRRSKGTPQVSAEFSGIKTREDQIKERSKSKSIKRVLPSRNDIPQVSNTENDFLINPFTEKEFYTNKFFGVAQKVKNGMQTRFWEDIWLGDTPLKNQYPILYNVAIFLSRHWLRVWPTLQKLDQKEAILAGSARLEFVVKQILSFHECRFSNRICNDGV